MSKILGNLIFIFSLTGKGILLNVLTVSSSAAENLLPGYFSAENPTLFWNCGHYLLLPPAGERPQRKHPSSGAFLMGELVSIWWSFHWQHVNSQQEANTNCKNVFLGNEKSALRYQGPDPGCLSGITVTDSSPWWGRCASEVFSADAS